MKKWLVRISIGFNVLVIVLALGTWFGRQFFIDKFLDEMYASRVSFFDSFPLHNNDVVMIGDSITDGGRWEEIFPDLAIRNRGIGGDTTRGVLARLDGVIAQHPAAVFIKIGTNDLVREPERAASYRHYREIVSRIQSGSPATDIYVQSLLPRDVSYREEVEAFNAELVSIVNELGVTFIDLYPAFLAPDGSLRDELTRDELHLTGEGYRLWQAQLQPYMEKYAGPVTH